MTPSCSEEVANSGGSGGSDGVWQMHEQIDSYDKSRTAFREDTIYASE